MPEFLINVNILCFYVCDVYYNHNLTLQEASHSDSGLRAVVQRGYEPQEDKPICP